MDRIHDVFVEHFLNAFSIWVSTMVWKVKEAWSFYSRLRLFSMSKGRKAVECFLKGPVEEVMIVSSSAKAVEEKRERLNLILALRDKSKDAVDTRDDDAGADRRCVCRFSRDVKMEIQWLVSRTK